MFFILFQVISIKDNDSLAARLAAEVQADLLILMSDVDGIYTCPPSEEGARLINTYSPQHAVSIQYGKKSRVGLGGMDSKVTQFYSTPKLSKFTNKIFL
jgi:delta-1-pyrroline-5-carboxylate synthetase